MSYRRPLLEVRSSGGLDILPRLSGLWIAIQVTDKDGQESDTARVSCVRSDRVALPRRGDEFEILMGWADEGLISQGRFSFQKPRFSGDPRHGELVELQFRSADFVDDLKKTGREHYDDVTFGDLVKKLAQKAGLSAEVDPDLAGHKLGYRLRWNQSLIDFGTELADELGATLKPAGGKLIATRKGGGKSASGKELEPIIVRESGGYGYEIELDPRPEAGGITATWQDEKSGKRKTVRKTTGLQGPDRALQHPYRSEDDAGAAADAEAYEATNRSGSGWFGSPGLPRAFGGAPVTALEYGAGIDGPWKADSVEKTINAKGGFGTVVHVTAGKDKKGEKGK